jgi:hypothetical protein
MNFQEFIKKYGKLKTLHEIPWDDFPEELQQVCFGFVDEWLCSTPYDDLRNFSGFNNMSVYDLVRLTQAKPPKWKNPDDPAQMNLL